MRVLVYVFKRLSMLIPQLLLISVVVFFLIRLMPGNPAALIAGPLASPGALAGIEERLGLDKPIHVQYVIFLERILHGDLGSSWYTSNKVVDDLRSRAPATLELITLALLGGASVGIPLGLLSAMRPRSIINRPLHLYGLLSGAFPDFFFGLLFIFIFFFKLGTLPAPLGRLPPMVQPPPTVTGFYTIDSLLAGDLNLFRISVLQLLMPVGTLAFVAIGLIVKMTNATARDILASKFIGHARASGLTGGQVSGYVLRNALPPVVTVTANTYSYCLGGAVLIETVFAWAGLGQYAVQSVLQADYAALQGFVLFVVAFNLFIYLIVDLVYLALDPRISY